MNVQLEKGETIEDLQFAGLRFIQSDDAVKFGTDIILLSSFIELARGEKLVEFGTGTGILPILLSGRVKAEITGIEIQPRAAALARKNALINGLSNITILQGDLRDARKLVGRADVVAMNPPYDKVGTGEMSLETAERIARHEIFCTIEDVIRSASDILTQGGRFYLIHRASRLAEVLNKMKCCRIEPKLVRPVARRQAAEPGYVLVKGIKDAKEGMRLLPTLVIMGEDGKYTPEVKRIYHIEG